MAQRPVAPGFRVDPDGSQRFAPDPLTKDWQRGGENIDELQPGFERMPTGEQVFNDPVAPEPMPSQFPGLADPAGFKRDADGSYQFTREMGAPLERPDGGPSDTEAPYVERTDPKPWWTEADYEWDAHYGDR